MRLFLEIIKKYFKKLKSSQRRRIFSDYPISSSRECLKNVYLDTYKIFPDVVKVLYLITSIICKKIKLEKNLK